MPDKVFKPAYIKTAVTPSGEIDVDSPITITLSDESIDRQGDIVEGFRNLKDFVRDNPILLWQHQSDSPIGQMTRVWREGTQTLGKFLLGEAGTSDLVNTVRSLVRQGIIRAGSVGFRPGKIEPLDEDDPWGGLRLMANELMEFSLVSVPANSNALIHTNAYKALPADLRSLLFSEIADPMEAPAAKQLGYTSRVSGKSTPKHTPQRRDSAMSLTQRIEKATEDLVQTKDTLAHLVEDGPQDDEAPEEHAIQVKELTDKVNVDTASLDQLIAVEKALGTKTIARTTQPDTKSGSVDTPGPGRHITSRKPRKPGEMALASLSYLFRAHVQRESPMALLAADKPEDKDELELIIRAASAPADVPTAAWAGNLVQQTWGEFIELLRDTSVYPQLPGLRLEFGRSGQINLPRNDGRGTLSGDFVAEGAPIPVKEGVIGTVNLAPKAMKVISAYTRELGRQSNPAVQSVINSQILRDTSELLDTRLLDAGARDTIRPAGYRDPTETDAGNIASATAGATVANIMADTTAMIVRLMNARVATTAVWIMNPVNMVYLRNVQDAASGTFPFRAEVLAGTFQGFPIVASQNVAVDVVYLQGNGSVAYANAFAPMIEVSDQATLVFDDAAPDDIVGGGTATTQPTKSMFQTDSVAIKMTLGLDWRIIRVGGVQVLDTVAWGV
jgi:HK97 family phage major capsid protein/HK97 family phage prohead protease